METKKPNNPDAFPCDNKSDGYSGMTLRDYFAAKAMEDLSTNRLLDYSTIARRAYEIADALLKQREL